jgi:hypothetical protein
MKIDHKDRAVSRFEQSIDLLAANYRVKGNRFEVSCSLLFLTKLKVSRQRLHVNYLRPFLRKCSDSISQKGAKTLHCP